MTPASRPPARGLARTVVRGASIAGAGYAVTQAVSLATYLVLARLLVPSDFGTFAAATVLVGLGLVVGESGMLAALIQRRDRVEEAFNAAFVASLAGGLALTLAGLAAAPLVGLVFHSFRTGVVAAVMSGSMFLRMALIVPSARLQRGFSFVRRGLIDPLGTLAFAGATVVGAGAGLGPWALVIGTYAQLLFDVVAAWSLVRWRPQLGRATVSTWRELVRFGRPVLVGNLVSRAAAEVPVLAVGRILGPAALGQFSYALRVASQPLAAIVDVGAYVLLPALARVAPDDARFRAAVLSALRWTCAIAFPLGLLLVPLGTPAVVLIFGAKWRAAGHAVMALGVFCAALGLDSIASETWKAAGRPDKLPRMQGLALVLTVVFVGALVPLGLNAVTIGMALAAIAEGAYAIRGIGQVARIPSRRLLGDVWPPALAAAAMAGVVFASEHGLLHSDRYSTATGIGILGLETAIAVGLYIPCLAALSDGCRTDLASLLRRARATRQAGRRTVRGRRVNEVA
jgi:PST family polysaccharide transporter